MLVFSHKIVFIENEAALLCVTMRERARKFASTIWCITIWYSFYHYRDQFLWCTFQTHFGMGMRYFQRQYLEWSISSRCNLSLDRHIVNIGIWKYVFTRVIIKIKIFSLALHSCRSCSTLVALVLHSRRSCCTRIPFVSHSCRSCLALVL